MQTRQTIVMALAAFASIAKCQMAAMDDDECSSTAQPSSPAILSVTTLAVDSVFTPIASPDDSSIFTFITTPDSTASSSAAPSSPPVQETTTEAASSTADATPTSDVVVPSASPATPTSTGEAATPSSGGSSSGQGLSGACAPDGMFNCVGGNQYQQCANGKWAPLIPLAAKCSEGQSMTLWRRDEGCDKGSFQSRRLAN